MPLSAAPFASPPLTSSSSPPIPPPPLPAPFASPPFTSSSSPPTPPPPSPPPFASPPFTSSSSPPTPPPPSALSPQMLCQHQHNQCDRLCRDQCQNGREPQLGARPCRPTILENPYPRP